MIGTCNTTVNLKGKSNHAFISIPSGRMRGDVDGDGKFTLADYNLIVNHINGTATITDETQLLCADINNDGGVSTKDNSISYDLYLGDRKAGAYTEITGNWTNNPNYETEEGQFYTDISIEGMSTTSSASVLVQGEYELGFFTKAECIEGALRIYARLCPIGAINAIVSWGTGDGTAIITAENYVPEGDIFIATYDVTTSEELKKARDDGKAIFVKRSKFYLPMTMSVGSIRFIFTGFQDSVKGVYITCYNDTWSSNDIIALPTVTTDDTGNALMVNSSGVWAKTLPADARINLGITYGTTEPVEAPTTGDGSVYFMEDDGSPLPIAKGGTGGTDVNTAKENLGFLWGTAEPTGTPVTGAGTIYFQIINDSGSSSGGANK